VHRIDALPPGLVAVVGDEQTGKTTYLRRLSGDAPASQGDAVWGLAPHMEKPLYMLSTGSRRKVALLTLLASGAPVVCLDQPYAALDMASIRALREYLLAQAEHPLRTWVIADYAVDEALLWRIVITLPTR
jgi:ABC-type multidrug transport system ATPase subunit